MKLNQTLAIQPRVARYLFLSSWLTIIVLLWGFYFYASAKTEATFERNLIQTVTTEAIVLDDHIDRSLSSIFGKLLSIQTLTEVSPSHVSRIDPSDIEKLIDNDRALRSLSLIDQNGKILASSSAENIGLTLPHSLSGLQEVQVDIANLSIPQLSAVQPYRDLSDLVLRRPSSTQQLMLASLEFKKENIPLRWVAVINISLFENLWQRIGHQDDTEISLLSDQGHALLSYHTQALDHTKLNAEILKRLEDKQIGYFNFGKNDQFLVVYRATSQQPKIFVSISNRAMLSTPLHEEKTEMLQLALGLTLFFSSLFWLGYIWYQRYEKAVTFSSNLLRGITAHVMMTRTDLNGAILEANEPFLKMTGYTLEEVIGQNHRMFNSNMQSRSFYQTLWQTIHRGEIWKGTFRNKTKNNQIIWVNATIIPYRDQWGHILFYTALFSDTTKAIEVSEQFERERKQRESLEQLNSALRTDLNLDHLTHIANRRALDQFLKQLQDQPEMAIAPFSMLMLDLDHFKNVNDTWGHEVGDEVLKELSRRWSEQIRVSDMLARLGGEEFTAVLGKTSLESARLVAEKIRSVTECEPVQFKRGGKVLSVPMTVSIGIVSVMRLKDADFKQLFRDADEALYEAKHSGRNCIRSRNV